MFARKSRKIWVHLGAESQAKAGAVAVDGEIRPEFEKLGIIGVGWHTFSFVLDLQEALTDAWRTEMSMHTFLSQTTAATPRSMRRKFSPGLDQSSRAISHAPVTPEEAAAFAARSAHRNRGFGVKLSK